VTQRLFEVKGEHAPRGENCVWRESDSKKWAVIEAVTNPPMGHALAFPARYCHPLRSDQ